ncbi:PGN_0703 family putative restriction endonuclease [Flavobacterium sp.]|uniref:PGN_0703 family putative restriction endonuclease n=1 Tax=Flavobacterium sp. TaxID=239 RepID=UPI003A8CF807
MNNKTLNNRILKNIIIDKAKECNLNCNDKGYLNCNTDNLMFDKGLWDKFQHEFVNGQGSELKSKFNAVHSSAALCVNNFALFKEKFKEVSFCEYSDFTEAVFEKKLPTGISTPNLDFYLENKDFIIGIESKFTETLSKKLPNQNQNLEKYLNRSQLNYLDTSFNRLINYYIKCTEKKHLDCAQLIKHAIGLIKAGKEKKKPVLVYLYWLPKNYNEFEVFKKHSEEVVEFTCKIKELIDFIPMSYLDFWNTYQKQEIMRKAVENLRKRYEFDI